LLSDAGEQIEVRVRDRETRTPAVQDHEEHQHRGNDEQREQEQRRREGHLVHTAPTWTCASAAGGISASVRIEASTRRSPTVNSTCTRSASAGSGAVELVLKTTACQPPTSRSPFLPQLREAF